MSKVVSREVQHIIFPLTCLVEMSVFFFGCVQTEIAKLRELLAASEKQLDEECHKRMELSQQVSKLTEMRELFQLQMDTAGYIGSAAEKKVQWHCRSHEL